MLRSLLCSIALLLLLVPLHGQAQTTGSADDAAVSEDTAVSEDAVLEDGEDDLTWTHTVTGGARAVYLPSGILDAFFDQHANTWQDGNPNFAFGVDYTLRRVGSWEFNAGAYWTDLSMPDGYWVEKDKDLSAADFTRVGLSTIALEAEFFGFWDIIPELSWYYGGGIWAGVILGELEKANIDDRCPGIEAGDISGCSNDGFFEPEEGIPPFIGFVSVTTGLRLVLEERFVMKLEGGFNGLLFGGLSMGTQFF